MSASELRPLHLQILEQTARGARIEQAARALHYSRYHIRDERQVLVERLQARNITHAVAIAIRRGLI